MHRIWTGLVRIQFNIIYIMRTKDVVAKLRCPSRDCVGCFPGLLCCDPKMLPVLHRTHCTHPRRACSFVQFVPAELATYKIPTD
jgi:hypothetical protein